MDRRTPELKLILLMEEQLKHLREAYDNFKLGRTDLNQAALHSEQIGIALAEQSREIIKEKETL